MKNIYEAIVHKDRFIQAYNTRLTTIAVNPTKQEWITSFPKGAAGVLCKNGDIVVGDGNTLSHSDILDYANVPYEQELCRLQIWNGQVLIECWLSDAGDEPDLWTDALLKANVSKDAPHNKRADVKITHDDVMNAVEKHYGLSVAEMEQRVSIATQRFVPGWKVRTKIQTCDLVDFLELTESQSKLRAGVAAAGLAMAGATTALSSYVKDQPKTEIVRNNDDQKKQEAKRELTALAFTIWAEARSEGEQGMRAVGHVIMNRMRSSRNFGDSIRSVVTKRKAFSCWNENDPNRDYIRNIEHLPKNSPDRAALSKAYDLAEKIMTGKDRDPTKGAIFYHTKDVSPKWASGVTPVVNISDHIFYRDDRKA